MDADREESPFSISIRDGGLECEVTVRAGFDPESTGESLCLNALRDQSIEITADVQKRVAGLMTLHEADTDSLHALLVAQGQAPEHGEDGWLEILPKFDADQQTDSDADSKDCADADPASQDAGDSVDHHERSAFALVEVGERIGTLHSPQPGTDGRSVTGETIVARQGKPITTITDESVVVRDDGAIESTMSGVVQIEGRKVRVLQKLDIRNSVDFSTGNIDFPGDVIVDKGVKDGFRVQSKLDIMIRGLVEAASISAGRDLIMLGGAACREKGKLAAVRDIEARYLNECDLKAGRNLTVEKEIINANIAVGANLISPNCTVIGGTTFVTGACEIAEIGSERNIQTELTLGKEREADDLTGRAESLLQTIGDRLRKSQTEHEQYQKNAAKLTHTQAEHMTELQFEIGAYSKLEGTLTGAVEGLNKAVDEVAAVDLTVQKRMWRGVTILLGDWEAFIEEPIKGPFRVTLDSNGKPILTDLTSGSSVELSTVARVRSRIEDEGADEAIAA